MITGIRTLKAYGWEEHYLNKLSSVRNKQEKTLLATSVLSTLGYNLFQNMAIFAVFLIFLNQWYQGIELTMAMAVPIMALVYYLFITVNCLTFIAIFNINAFSAILRRISRVLALEEFQVSSEPCA